MANLAALLPPGPDALPLALLQPLVAALAANLAHQHSRVRGASLQAVHALVQRGMSQAVLEEGVLPAVRPLAHDHAPAIRAALFACVAQWAGAALPPAGQGGDDDGRAANQCRAFLPLLLPLVLLGLTDEAEPIRADALAALEAIGARLAEQVGAWQGHMCVVACCGLLRAGMCWACFPTCSFHQSSRSSRHPPPCRLVLGTAATSHPRQACRSSRCLGTATPGAARGPRQPRATWCRRSSRGCCSRPWRSSASGQVGGEHGRERCF